MEADIGGLMSSGGAYDMSIIGLFNQADVVVKIVMLLLCIASLLSWTVVFEKIFTIGRQLRKAKKFEHTFWSGQVIDRLYDDVKGSNDGYLARVFVAGIREYKEHSRKNSSSDQVMLESVSSAMRIEINRVLEKCEGNIEYLATIGSTAPFIGLFGTVWGIMQSFQSIAFAKNATLAVVAPSIAEALLATAAGLVVAIPAVFFYNRISSKINLFSERAENFAAELLLLLSKEGRR